MEYSRDMSEFQYYPEVHNMTLWSFLEKEKRILQRCHQNIQNRRCVRKAENGDFYYQYRNQMNFEKSPTYKTMDDYLSEHIPVKPLVDIIKSYVPCSAFQSGASFEKGPIYVKAVYKLSKVEKTKSGDPKITDLPLEDLTEDNYYDIVDFAHAGGPLGYPLTDYSLSTNKKGDVFTFKGELADPLDKSYNLDYSRKCKYCSKFPYKDFKTCGACTVQFPRIEDVTDNLEIIELVKKERDERLREEMDDSISVEIVVEEEDNDYEYSCIFDLIECEISNKDPEEEE